MVDRLTIAPRARRGKAKLGATRSHVPPWVRRECKLLGADPAAVADLKAALAERDRLDSGRRREMRELAWQKLKPRGCWPFWRHGFQAHYGKRVDAADYTVIPHYDELHAEVAAEFPEWAADEYAFFCELCSPCPKLATAAELWGEALGLAREGGASRAANDEIRMTNDEGTF